ncbi:MAG: ABC transporter ATP-binding protein [Gammaproteobacteria bacterium]
MSDPVLQVDDLSVHYEVRGGGFLGRGRQQLKAVQNISFELRAGETLGVVGETGCGKSSLGRAILQLVRPAGGRVVWQGRDLCGLSSKELKPIRKDLQVVFQDPLSSLNPRMTIGETIGEPLRIHEPALSAAQREEKVAAMMERVGLLPELTRRYPNEFSGGQCQRVSIARAMILQPRVIVCDEPVSALDVSIQAQICNLLRALQRDTGIAMIFITHDLSVVRYMAQRILVMYLGQLMELSSSEAFFASPLHPYSRALLNAVPEADPDRPISTYGEPLGGEVPSPMAPPSGCVFRTRCEHATPICVSQKPILEQPARAHEVACHHWQRLIDAGENS